MQRPSLGAVLTAASVALPLSQLGHALAYSLHYGPGALTRQSTGVHQYFPMLLGSAAALVGGLLLVSLLLIGLARRLVALRGAPSLRTSWPLLPVVLLLLFFQLGIFVGQETLEGASLAQGPGGFGRVLVYGAAGQLPVALAAGIALVWIFARVVRAVCALRRPVLFIPAPPTISGALPIATPVAVPTGATASRAHPRRGPPALPRNR